MRGTNGKSGDDEEATEAAALTETQADTSAESKAAAEEAPSNGAGKADVVVMTARGSANNGGTSTKVTLLCFSCTVLLGYCDNTYSARARDGPQEMDGN